MHFPAGLKREDRESVVSDYIDVKEDGWVA
jgi:hypothetical protein